MDSSPRIAIPAWHTRDAGGEAGRGKKISMGSNFFPPEISPLHWPWSSGRPKGRVGSATHQSSFCKRTGMKSKQNLSVRALDIGATKSSQDVSTPSLSTRLFLIEGRDRLQIAFKETGRPPAKRTNNKQTFSHKSSDSEQIPTLDVHLPPTVSSFAPATPPTLNSPSPSILPLSHRCCPSVSRCA